jgi:glycerol-3-phosphate acyltransferase PlsY
MTAALGYAIGIVLSYLIGSIIFGYLFGRMGGIDIRRWGSKNVGATNVARVLGYKRGIVVFCLDVGKGLAATGLIGRLMGGMMGTDPALFMVLCGAAVIVGHTFPVWLGFKGGKGVATALGVWLIINPLATLIALAVFAALVGLWRYVSLGSIGAALVLPAAVYLVGFSTPEMVFALVVSALVLVRHIGNIGRLIKGAENRIGGPKKKKAAGKQAAL